MTRVVYKKRKQSQLYVFWRLTHSRLSMQTFTSFAIHINSAYRHVHVTTKLQNVICHATWVQTCELETHFNCSVACRLSTAFFQTLKKTIYLEETFISGITLHRKWKYSNQIERHWSISHRAADKTNYFILIATQQRICNRKQYIFSYISLPIHDKKIIKCSDAVVLESWEVNNATAGSFSDNMICHLSVKMLKFN